MNASMQVGHRLALSVAVGAMAQRMYSEPAGGAGPGGLLPPAEPTEPTPPLIDAIMFEVNPLPPQAIQLARVAEAPLPKATKKVDIEDAGSLETMGVNPCSAAQAEPRARL